MSNKYLISYEYNGGRYSLELDAESMEDVEGRLEAIKHTAKYDGLIVLKVDGSLSQLINKVAACIEYYSGLILDTIKYHQRN